MRPKLIVVSRINKKKLDRLLAAGFIVIVR
jgi:hypothetical protein